MISVDDFVPLFEREVGRPPRRGEILGRHANFRIGGPADLFFEAADRDELVRAVLIARRSGMRFAVIGGGFNLLFDDAGYRGLIIKNAARGVAVRASRAVIEAASGTSLGDVVALAAENGLGGLEFLAGIPGTVGGAVYGNAGAFGRAAGDFLEEAVLLDAEGAEIRSGRGDFEFAYRHSRLKKSRDVVLGAEFRLTPAAPGQIRAKIEDYLSLRARRHPPQSTAYPGSYFKNPVLPDGCRQAAGLLLQEAGARGLRVGAAAVYAGHCNFIINEGGAAARDVRALADELKKRVRDRFGIDLEEEVIFLEAASPGF